jgi:ankyrin repeat protein
VRNPIPPVRFNAKFFHRFLLTRFLVEEIGDMISLGEFKLMIREIQASITHQTASKEIAALQATYGYLIDKINRQTPRLKDRAREVILWTLAVTRPLRSEELAHAFEIEIGGEIDIGEFIEATRGLVTRDPESDTIQLSHRTARAYLERYWREYFPSTHSDITNRLVTCLATNGMKRGIYGYAATEWGFHANKATGNAQMFASIMDFLRNKLKVYESCEIIYRLSLRGRQPKAISEAHLAAHFGLLLCLTILAAEGANFDDRDENGETPLLFAARNGQEDAVVWLLERGVDVDVGDFELNSTMHHTVFRRWKGPLQLLLTRNARITANIENMTPIHYATRSGWEEGLALLLEAGVDIDTRVQRLNYRQAYRNGRRIYELADIQKQLHTVGDTNISLGFTPLHVAALCGKRKLVSFLLDHGADPSIMSEHGETPLHLAVCRREKSTPDGDGCHMEYRIEFILDVIDISDEEEYADTCQYILKEISGVVGDLLSRPATNVNARTFDGSQALHLVCYRDRRSALLVRLLVEHGADPSGRNSKQQTPLLLACKEGNAEAARLLLDHGSNVMEADDEGRNALHYAAMSIRKEILLLVLERSKSRRRDLILSQDKHGRNVLHHALSRPVSYEILEILLEQGAEIDSVDKGGMTPLVTYISQWLPFRPRDSVELLLRWGAGISYKSSDRGLGLGHIYAGSITLDVEVLKLLADAGLDLGAVDAEGQTILRRSAQAGSLTQPALKFLLSDIRLSLDAVDSAGKRPLDYAREMSNKEHHRHIFDPGRWRRTEKIILGQWPDPAESP